MASDQPPVAPESSEASLLQSSSQHVPAASPSQVASPDAADSTSRSNSLKRAREDSLSPPEPATEEPSYKAPRFTLRSDSPIQITVAVAALEAERRRREEDLAQEPSVSSYQTNHSILEELVRSATAAEMHLPAAPTAAMDAGGKPVDPVTAPITDEPTEHHPSATDSTPLGADVETSQPGHSSIVDAQVTESPTPMEIDPKLDEQAHNTQTTHQETTHQETTHENAVHHGEGQGPPPSLSYPGPLHAHNHIQAPPTRTMTYPLPTSSGHDSPPTMGSQQKKHKCPYCDTEFTRHHNLKSHLLTHSHEKPFKCQQCDMRFRRLHDLKRHTKLHTGEKPHICPRCDRKFARGDALARHSKGAGGCAGRRSSMGSFAEDDMTSASITDVDDARMSGALYPKYTDGLSVVDDARRRASLPNVNRQSTLGVQANAETAPRQAEDYSSANSSRGVGGGSGMGLVAPDADRNSVSTTTSPSMPGSMGTEHTASTSTTSMPLSAGSTSLYLPSGMTESPKPLSPAVPAYQEQDSTHPSFQSSPGLTQQFQQHQHPHAHAQSHAQQPQYVSRDSDQRTSPNLAGPAGSSAKHPAQTAAATSDGRYASGQNGVSTGTRDGSAGHVENGNNMFVGGDTEALWAYLHALAEKQTEMERTERETQAHVAALTEEVRMLQSLLRPKEPTPVEAAPVEQ